MILFPNAKINLGLNVTEKRADGFHNLETVFYPFKSCDALEVIKNTAFSKGKAKAQMSVSGIKVGGKVENNLVVKAFDLLDKNFDLGPVKIHLHKSIPMGAGLGGGSADAAFMLNALNELFELEITMEELAAYAGMLGSDCAFFIYNSPLFATGKGNEFEELNFQLPALKISVVHPGIHSNTAEAYSGIRPKKPQTSIKEILQQDLREWKTQLHNDFEEPIFKKYAEIQKVKQRFYDEGAVYSSMSGSGSAVFAIFEKEIPEINWPKNYQVLKEI